MTNESKLVKKAVFPVAGFGTRFLPATKAMPKELLPILDKPLIQYAAEEAVSAGMDTLIFVTGRNKRAIEDHFDSNKELELALQEKDKGPQAEMVRNILPSHVNCVFVRQPEQLGLGHAVLCAERVVGDEPFALLLADDFITNEGRSVTKELVDIFIGSKKSQVAVMEVNGPDISKYGVLKFNKKNNQVSGLIEKPDYRKAPSNKACIGRYVLTADIFNILKSLKPGRGNEIQLADALNMQAENGQVEAKTISGKRFDCGSVKGFVDATNFIAKQRGLIE